jgi:hypothetical protein
VLFFFFLYKCQGKTRKDGARPALFLVVVLFYVFFVLFYVFLCCYMYCLFCDVPCIVCVYMCTEQLPPGGYPVAVKCNILNHIISFSKYYSYLKKSISSVTSNKPRLNCRVEHVKAMMKNNRSLLYYLRNRTMGICY